MKHKYGDIDKMTGTEIDKEIDLLLMMPGDKKPNRKPRLTGLKLEIAKAYKGTPGYKLDLLLKEEQRWSRKLTIAQNKLEHVRARINKFTIQLISPPQRKENSDGITTTENRPSDNIARS